MMNSNVLNASDVPQYLVEPILNLYKAGTSPQLISQSFGLDLNSVIAFLAGQQSESTNEFFESLLKKSQDFRCTITSKLMVDPVVASDGKLYDQDALKAYLKTSKVSPVTGERFQMSKLFQLNDLKQRIVEFCKTSLVKLNSILKLNTESEEPLKFAADCLSVLISNGQSLAEILEKLSALAPPKQKVLISMLGRLLPSATQSKLLVELAPIMSFRPSVTELFKSLLNQRKEDDLSDEEFSCLSALLTSEEVPFEVTELAFLASKFCDKTQLCKLQEQLKAVCSADNLEFADLKLRSAELCVYSKDIETAKTTLAELKKDARLRKQIIDFYDRVGWVTEKKAFIEESFSVALVALVGEGSTSSYVQCLDDLMELSKMHTLQADKRFYKRPKGTKKDDTWFAHPEFIYSYTLETASLHRTEIATGEVQTLTIPDHKFKLWISWVELPGGDLFIAGGSLSNAFTQGTNETYVISLPDLEITKKPDMLTARWAHGCIYSGGFIYMMSGYNGKHVSECEKYDCNSEIWEEMPNIPTAVRCINAIEVPSTSCIYILGGYNDSAYQDCIQEYNIDLVSWRTLTIKLVHKGYLIPCFKLDQEATDIFCCQNGSLYKIDTNNQLVTEVRQGLTVSTSEHFQGPSYFSGSKLFVSRNTGAVSEYTIGDLA